MVSKMSFKAINVKVLEKLCQTHLFFFFFYNSSEIPYMAVESLLCSQCFQFHITVNLLERLLSFCLFAKGKQARLKILSW